MAQTRRKLASSAVLFAAIGCTGALAESSPASPDAELVRLCGEFASLELQWRAIYDGPGAILDDDAAEIASTGMGDRMNAILAEIEAIHAVTADGVLARAQVLAVQNGDFGFSFDHPDTMSGRLLACLLRDAAAVGGRA